MSQDDRVLSGSAGKLDNDWEIGEKSGLVDIGTHKLWLNARGPDRIPGEPAIIIIQGLANSITGWAAVERQLTPLIRVISYDRTGYGQSDTADEPPTATQIISDLDQLLKKANISPPFITVAHSWGGVLSREFLALRQKDIAGKVFVDANQELTLALLDWRRLAESPVLNQVDWNTITGIETLHHLTDEEFRKYQATEATEKHQKQAALEYVQYPHSFQVLAAKAQFGKNPPLLGDCPVCVIKGDNGTQFGRLYAAGVSAGNGTEAERGSFREMLRIWDATDRMLQTGNLGLSRNGRFIEVPDTGHNVHVTSPETIVDGVKWVLSELKRDRR